MAQRHKHVIINATDVGSIPTRENTIFLYSHSGNEAKRGVEFHHLIFIASRAWLGSWRKAKNGNDLIEKRRVLTLGF